MPKIKKMLKFGKKIHTQEYSTFICIYIYMYIVYFRIYFPYTYVFSIYIYIYINATFHFPIIALLCTIRKLNLNDIIIFSYDMNIFLNTCKMLYFAFPFQ